MHAHELLMCISGLPHRVRWHNPGVCVFSGELGRLTCNVKPCTVKARCTCCTEKETGAPAAMHLWSVSHHDQVVQEPKAYEGDSTRCEHTDELFPCKRPVGARCRHFCCCLCCLRCMYLEGDLEFLPAERV